MNAYSTQYEFATFYVTDQALVRHPRIKRWVALFSGNHNNKCWPKNQPYIRCKAINHTCTLLS